MRIRNYALPLLAGLLLSPAPVVAATAPPSAPSAPPSSQSRLDTYALRLRPGDDLKQGLLAFAKARGLRAGAILTCVGSLRAAKLRLADQQEATAFAGKFEIVSLVGTLTERGAHLHLAIADVQGRTVGGHLVDGCTVYTTAEIVVGELRDLTFGRSPDPATTFHELDIQPRKAP